MPGNIFDVADRFKRDLLARESAAIREIRGYYRDAERRIIQRLEKLVGEMEQWRRDHRPEQLPTWWLFERDRLQALQGQIEQELERFSERAAARIAEEQRLAVERAGRDAEALVQTGLSAAPQVYISWSRLPESALEQLIGTLQDGSPLRDLLDTLGPEASNTIRHELVSGLALGINPRAVARRCRDALNGNRVRAETIARTEILRAYREATRQSYMANSDVLRGWIWHAARDARTCVMCWAMHGTRHSLEERLDDHPRGRCAMVPDIKPWAELGIDVPEPRVEIEKGEELFDRLPASQQREILGPSAFEAYQNLEVDLRDFVARKSDERWGTMRYASSLRAARRQSGMPTVTWAGERERAQPVGDVRSAIRALRDAGVEMRGVRLQLVGEPVEDWLGAMQPDGLIMMRNNTQYWRRENDYWRTIFPPELGVRLPSSASERFADTLAHEYGHLLVLNREGPGYWEEQNGINSMPFGLLNDIAVRLQYAGIDVSWYNISEAIAEDVRWYLQGRDTRPNRMTYPADIMNLEQAWGRAGRIWRWLNER